MDRIVIDNIKIARRCMNFSGIKCGNKGCTNEYCPLNQVYDTPVVQIASGVDNG